ncbi:hypothetical protein MSAN_01129600 [Mycena sanguinolenta]|uniref:Uncharacterized protein n=1 Tax=Mycena sanguinolenta TaxID=230812 RepID=A0A8H6YMF8_9AGAR|nr:hypothetical protein MSAN_01129600 [Mycena sanguinolenta]
MPSPRRLLALAALLVSTAAIIPPGHQGPLNQPPPAVTAPTTDNDAIAQTATQVNQKTAPPVDTPPNAVIPPVSVTAIDGTVTNTTVSDVAPNSNSKRRRRRFGKRQSGFEKIFDGLAADQHDASIEGTAYLTYTVVSNATYNVQDCLDWCTTIQGCEQTSADNRLTLKAADGESTASLTPDTPDGYELVFGPTDGANNAPGYMGFSFIDQYDVDACAQLCNGRGADPNGGGCAYFNIWRAVVNGVPTTYTCSMYYLVADESTAVNYGQGDLVVTLSRGYARKSALIDGGFEGYTACDTFCLTASYANWIGTSPSGGDTDASIIYFPAYAHTGNVSALLGAAFGDDADAGTLTPAQPLQTDSGANYVVQCFMASAFSGPQIEATAKVDILWNGVRVGGTSGYTEYTFVQASVVGTGSDKLSFVGGAAPAWTFIDDCKVYKA